MSDDPDMSMRANFTSSDGGGVTLRQPILGMGPSILITPSVEDDGVVFELEACDFPPDACAEVLEMLATALQSRSEEPA